MIIKLPRVTKVYNKDSGTVEVKKDFLECELDTSFKAHLKFEEQFGEQLKCDLVTYTERVRAMTQQDSEVGTTSQVLASLKLLYCYINSRELPTFKDFCGLFDEEVAVEIIETVSKVLEEVNKTASKN